jgi:hypothetical protein
MERECDHPFVDEDEAQFQDAMREMFSRGEPIRPIDGVERMSPPTPRDECERAWIQYEGEHQHYRGPLPARKTFRAGYLAGRESAAKFLETRIVLFKDDEDLLRKAAAAIRAGGGDD